MTARSDRCGKNSHREFRAAADLLFPDGGQRAAINVATSHATIAVADIDRYIVDIIGLRRRFPSSLLGNALHEFGHHHSFSTLVGLSLAVLAADVRGRLEGGRHA